MPDRPGPPLAVEPASVGPGLGRFKRWAPVALALLPLGFNPFGTLAFEATRAAALQLVAIGLALTALRAAGAGRLRARLALPRPVRLALLCYLAATLLATVLSIAPVDSLVGGYDRLQGWLTLGATILVALTAAGLLDRRQLIDALALGSLPICLYALLQHAGLDPLTWLQRTFGPASTLGSSTALGGYLAALGPPTLARALVAARGQDESGSANPARRLALIVALLLSFGLQVVVVLLTGVRGALFGLALGLLASTLLLPRAVRPFGAARLALTIVLAGLLGLALLNLPLGPIEALRDASPYLGRLGELGSGEQSTRERLLIWEDALETSLHGGGRLFWGYGPDTQALALEQRYPVSLAERLPDLRFDRAHSWPLDLLLTTGLFGLASFGATVGLAARTALAGLRADADGILVAGLLGGLLAHLAETAVAFPSIASLFLSWLLLGLACQRPDSLPPPPVREAPPPLRLAGPAWFAAGLLLLGLAGLACSPVLADVAYTRALAYHGGEDAAGETAWLRRAAALAPYRDLYAVALAEAQSSQVRDERSPAGRAALLDEAEASLRRAIWLRPAEPYNHLDLGLLLELRAEAEASAAARVAALAAYETAVELSPARLVFRDALGAALLRAEQPAAALEVLRLAEQRGEPSADRAARLGEALLALGREAEALASYERALSRNPRLALAHAGLARLYERRGDLVGAAESARRAARFDTRDWRYRELLAGYELRLGDVEAALEQARAAARFAPAWEHERLSALVAELRARR